MYSLFGVAPGTLHVTILLETPTFCFFRFPENKAYQILCCIEIITESKIGVKRERTLWSKAAILNTFPGSKSH